MTMGTPRKIDFSAGQASGYDELAGASPAFLNALPEGSGFRARPGIRTSSSLPSAVTSQVECMAPFQGHLVFVTADRRIIVVKSDGTWLDTSAGAVNATVLGTVKPTIYAAGDFCIVAGGNIPQKLTKGLTSERLGSGLTAPPNAIDIAMNTNRIIAIINGSDEFYWSGSIKASTSSWDTDLEYSTAEARPDYNVAIRDTANEVWIWGKTTTQIFQPDPSYTYAPAVATDVGCVARDSVVRVETRMAWLDDHMRFQLTDGRAVDDSTDISRPIRATLDSISTTSDCFGFRLRIGQHDLLVWVFPTAGKTLCYSLGQKAWCELRGWRSGRWQSFLPTAYCWWPEKRMHVVGMSDGTLAELTFDAATDLDDVLPWRVRTGFNDHDNGSPKTAMELVIRTRPFPSETASVGVKWRDDLGAFCDSVTVEGSGLSDCNLSVQPVGEPYITRQYEFWGQADTTSYVSSVVEDLTLTEEG
jgi:hypothetical protein